MSLSLGGFIASVALCLSGMVFAQTRDWPSERAPKPLAARDIKFPPYEVRTLPNGLQVIAVLHHEQPAVSMRLLIRAGTAFDPKGKIGLVHLLASLLDQGTTTKSAEELNDAVDFIGGSMNTGAGSDLSFLNMVVMKDSFETGLRLLADMAEHPEFAPDEIERQRQQIVSGLRVNMEDPEFIANSVFDRLVYGFNPYGMPDNGTPETIAAVNRDDLIAYHTKYFAPNNAILAVVGDVTADEAFNTAAKVFGDWKSHDVPKEKLPDPPKPGRRVVVIDKPDSVQTEVRVGHIGIPRNHSDYMALNLAVRILGGEGSNRLHQVLRTQRALTYGAQANMDTLKDSGDIEAETNTRSEATGEVLRLIVDEFWRLQRERVSDGELAAAKAYMTGSFPLTVETPDAIAVQVLNAVFYGLPLQELQTYRERVNAVTPDDIERVARFYLKPDAVSVVLVGNASVFTPQLRGVGFGRYETIPIDNLDLLTSDFKKGSGTGRGAPAGRSGRSGFDSDVSPAGEAAASPVMRLAAFQQSARSTIVPEEGDKARALLEKIIAAKGGRETLAGIKSIKAVTAATMQTQAGAIDTETTTYLEYPNRVRVETTTPQGTQLQIFDGEHGWVRDRFGVHDVPPAALGEMEASLKRDTIGALLAADRGELRARLLPDVKDADGVVRHALELSSPRLDPLVFHVDAGTGLIAKQTYVVRAPGQPLVEEFFSDYRPVKGVSVAFKAEVRSDGRPILTRRLTDITIAQTMLDAKLFSRPTS